jgi:hypothetical protein
MQPALGVLDVYCGAKTTDLDHLRPLVQNKRPTGYVHEIGNLVPACGPCNQSKGGQDWRQWMQGNARGSPTTKGVNNIAERINQLERFENWAKLRKEDLQSPAQKEEWEKHWENLEVILKKMAEAQIHAEKLREAMQAALQSSRDCQGRAE